MKEMMKKSTVLLMEDHVCFGGMNLFYRLSVLEDGLRHRFLISVSLLNEYAEEAVGEDLERALRIYRKVTKGAVTPCALCDVLTDLRMDGKKVKKSLYNP